MAVMNPALHPASPNRRRRVRHKIQMPAYATFTAEAQGSMLDLHEIVDISENGVAIQCHSPLPLERRLNLCLDLADSEHIYTTGHVVWSNASGRTGLRFSELSPDTVSRLRQWLFVNVMAGVANSEANESANREATSQANAEATEVANSEATPEANAEATGETAEAAAEAAAFTASRVDLAPRPSYTDTLAAVSAVQRQAEALGSDLAAVLQLIAGRAQTLVRASGAAIALADSDPDFMICRASSGPIAPPVGARLQVGSGFSGQCVKTGMLLFCDDTESDSRVDRDSCRALGVRSILAAPVRVGGKSLGILEAFAGEPDAFTENDSAVLQRLVQTVLAAVNRAARAEDLPPLGAAPAARFAPSPGSVLFASDPGQDQEKKIEGSDQKPSGGISLPRSHLILLVCFAAFICGVLGYALAPLIQTKLHERRHSSLPTVLASSQPPASASPAVPSLPSVESASVEQLQQMAGNNDPAAENALGLRYATGTGVKLDENMAILWFTRAAEQGNVAAQSKLGTIYFSGRGVPQDLSQAYFWMFLARASGDPTSKTLAPSVMARLSRAQANSIERQAEAWLQQRIHTWKPPAGH